MSIIYLDATPEVKSMARMAFPNYTGRKFKLDNSGRPVNVTSYWDGGSRDYYSAVNLSTGERIDVPQNGTPFDGGPVAPDGVTVPAGYVIAMRSIFGGKDMGVTFYVNPETATQFLAAPDVLTEDELNVLGCTRRFKNTYGGMTDIRFRESGLTRDAWDTASDALKSRKLLNKAGAITTSGRNAINQNSTPVNRW